MPESASEAPRCGESVPTKPLLRRRTVILKITQLFRVTVTSLHIPVSKLVQYVTYYIGASYFYRSVRLSQRHRYIPAQPTIGPNSVLCTVVAYSTYSPLLPLPLSLSRSLSFPLRRMVSIKW